jgi:hypothetical protein
MLFQMKFVLTLFLFAITLFSYAQIDLEAGLVAYYPFDNSADDESTFSNDASVINNVNYVEEEINEVTETVATFNGDDSYIFIPAANQINFSNEDEFTISLWINAPEDQLDLDGGVNDILSKWTNSGSQPFPFLLRLFNSTDDREGVLNGAIYQGDGSTCPTPPILNLYSNTTINDSEWHHIMFTRTSESRLQIYIDCELEVDFIDYSECTTENTAGLIIGRREATGPISRAFKGKLNDLRIYNRQLTSDEVNVLCGFVSSTTELDDASRISIFPNPVSRGAVVHFDLPNGYSLERFELFNAWGSSVGRFEPQSNINVPAGTYLMSVLLDNGQTLLKRLIVTE